MPTITPNLLGHQPPGYYPSGGLINSDQKLEEYRDKPDLDLLKAELSEVQSDANWYYNRCQNALAYWNSRWEGQTFDGKKWWSPTNSPDDIFPWPGSSDTRARTVKMVINEHRTVGMYALMNMKLQARTQKPFVMARESAQVTTLLNWQLFVKLQAEWHRESKLNLAWRNGYGCAISAVDWIQERRMDRIDINTVQFAQWVAMVTGQQFGMDEFSQMLPDKDYEQELLDIIQAMSPIMDRGEARSILSDLRDLRTATVKVPYVFKSQPRIRTLRPMVDVFFPTDTSDLQKARFVDEIERVSEVELYDRIDTQGYDPKFCEEACAHPGTPGNTAWIRQTNIERGLYGGQRPSSFERMIELHHFWHYTYDGNVPVLCKTIFHPDCQTYAWHGPCEYDHGEMPFHAHRFEMDERPILSSMGIAEIAYTWEQEQKTQFDARTDRVSYNLAPPLFSDHGDIEKMKKAFRPKTIIPQRRGTEPHFSNPLPYDAGAIQVSNDIQMRIDRFFGLFGPELDPQLKQMRQMEVVDDIIAEWKPVFQQVLKLDKQLLPDEKVAAVVGALARPFHLSRHEIQDEYEISATVDLRELDKEWIAAKAQAIGGIIPLDNAGLIDRQPIIQNLFEGIDYNLADMALRSHEQATEKEKTDEIATLNRIIGSGMPEPLPQGANYALRLDTAKQHLQSGDPQFPNPNLQRPDVIAVLQNRMQFFQRQLDQQQHAIIGRQQVAAPFSGGNKAPMITQGGGGY